MTEFHLLRPFWLLAFMPLLWMSWRLLRAQRGEGDWARWCDPALLPYLLQQHVGGKPTRLPFALLSLGGVLAIIALAGPVWERLPAPAFRNDAALVIALDLSRVMDAADLKPSRLERARYKIADILKQRKDGLTALLVYSGGAYTVTPLTDDVETINAQLSALSSNLMPAQGSRADQGMALATQLLQQGGLTQGDVLLITSGIDLDKATPLAESLKNQGYRLSVLGAGNEDGAPVPLPEGGFLQDTQGNIIVSKLAAPALRQLADTGGGLYQPLTADNSDLSRLLAFFNAQVASRDQSVSGNQMKIDQWLERGPWLLLPLLLIAALAFRRGYLAIAWLALSLPYPQPADAFSWDDLWYTRDQQAQRALNAGQPQQAAETFENPAWKAAAQYKAKQFAQAAQTLQENRTADAHYNRGNALAKQAQYPEAIKAYEEALKLDPNDEDAKHNKAEVEKALQKQKEQKQQQKQDKNKSGDHNQDKKDQDQKVQDQKNQEQPKDGQQSKDPSEDQQSSGDKQDQQNGQEENQPAKDSQGKDQKEEQTAADEAEKEQKSQPQTQPKPEESKEQTASQAAQSEEAKQAEQDKKADTADSQQKEVQQAAEQWLRRIPDDPGGLLKRKFYYQYQQRQGRMERP